MIILPWEETHDPTPFINNIMNIARKKNNFEAIIPEFVYKYIQDKGINAHIEVLNITGIAYTINFEKI